ncbi:hypothetical protein [Streptosporangium saharense]|uniref:Nodulation protein S (NodS) n=1 Tax=Streptosporangium saharense TaxID=1706840 RepID=A0A7W7QR56_9ACTN|nr:hypothetical protein [Streptosporangium saharense]MBB4918215.1 hypothetical protein [Streptosporangium saharense]
MTAVIAVLHAEDVALEFLSVLRRHAEEDVGVVIGRPATRVTLPGGLSLRERLELLAPFVAPGGNTAALPGPEEVAGLLGGAPGEVWTHSPADHRIRRARFGWTVSKALTGRAVTYSVGDNLFLQTVPGHVAGLTGAEAAAKIDFINRHAGELLRSRVPDRLVTTDRVPVVERFFTVDTERANRLYALISSLGEDAAVADDPWEFGRSPYEADRLDATAAWVGRWCAPGEGPLVEVGACEGELTRRLVGKGYTVQATEPNASFLARLRERDLGAELSQESLEELAVGRSRPAAAYLLIEMLYYDQDLALLDDLPTDRILLALETERLNDMVWPWLREQSVWRVAERVELAPPTLEFVCDDLAYLRKRGSRGLVLTRNGQV